ncbi:twin-arginine translocase subunit TatC [Lacibacterium aquatile]|uniref:Sec-independent protein translocase protein TatC n=2 Tax=Lacibacterium aquatile TaxID=1168082 RepID=A0ABW5DNN5_9PROT
MSLLDHLIELRKRLIWSMVAFIICFGFCYWQSERIFAFLADPLADALGEGRRLIYTDLLEAFFTRVKISMWAALFVSFPVIATQIWMFVAPGLYKNERNAFLPFLIATPVMFFLGAGILYYLILPQAFHFFLGFQTTGPVDGLGLAIDFEGKISEYLSLIMSLIFAFGLSFELPVLLTLLARVGIVSAAGLASKRRYAIVGVFVFAAVVTPPDVISQVSLAIPMWGLYEISILCARLIEKKRREKEEAEDADAGL